MNHTSDTAAGNGDAFTPQQAAALLDEATLEARRKLVPNPPWVLVTRGVLVLAACGAVWLSVRGQNPYAGPTNADIPILIAFIVLNSALAVGFRRRAGAGVSGPSRLRPAEIAIATLAWIAAVALVVALSAAGLRASEITRFVPHQANGRLVEKVRATIGVAPYRKAHSWVSPHGSNREGTTRKSEPP